MLIMANLEVTAHKEIIVLFFMHFVCFQNKRGKYVHDKACVFTAGHSPLDREMECIAICVKLRYVCHLPSEVCDGDEKE